MLSRVFEILRDHSRISFSVIIARNPPKCRYRPGDYLKSKWVTGISYAVVDAWICTTLQETNYFVGYLSSLRTHLRL